jgi:hypothetical protein
MPIPQQYRYISGRTLLGLKKLARCQSLPYDTWTPAANLWHYVFISHRWGSQPDPDPTGAQLAALQRLVQEIATIAKVISDERVGAEATRDRIAQVPSLGRQGTLQAAHLVFRTLCEGEAVPDAEARWDNGYGVLDVIGFWYDYACLPQDPKTPAEAQEFAQALQGIGELVLSERVSTLVLRKEGDGYLSRGWCFAESMIAQSKRDPYMPMVLRTDRWGQPISLFNSGPLAVFQAETARQMAQWEDPANTLTAWDSFRGVVEATALPLILKSERSNSEFALALEDTINLGARLLAHGHPWLAVLQPGATLDLAVPLATLLESQGLGCRDQRDAILVALLLLRSITSEDSQGEIALWREALVRFTEGLPLRVVRQDGTLVWR